MLFQPQRCARPRGVGVKSTGAPNACPKPDATGPPSKRTHRFGAPLHRIALAAQVRIQQNARHLVRKYCLDGRKSDKRLSEKVAGRPKTCPCLDLWQIDRWDRLRFMRHVTFHLVKLQRVQRVHLEHYREAPPMTRIRVHLSLPAPPCDPRCGKQLPGSSAMD